MKRAKDKETRFFFSLTFFQNFFFASFAFHHFINFLSLFSASPALNPYPSSPRDEAFSLKMRPAAAVSSSSRPVAQARNRRSPCSPSSSTAVAASISQTPSRRRFAPAAPRLPASAAALRVFDFQGAATTPSMARPAMASSASVRVEIRVQKRVPFGHTIAVVGVGSPALGGWEVGNSRAALTWTDGDVWTGEVVAERG